MGFDSYTWHSNKPDTWSRKDATPEEITFDKLSAPAVKALIERAAASDAERAAVDTFQQDEQVFRKLYPSYINNARNAQLMKHHWEEALGITVPTLSQIEESFFALRASGVIQLNAAAVAKENQADIAARADKIRADRAASEFNEADAYTMPLEELRQRAGGGGGLL